MADSWGGDEFQQPYAAWKKERTPERANEVLKVLHPTIQSAVGSIVGPKDVDNPTIVGRARLFALDAMDSHDPAKSEFGTHLYNHMQGLRRFSRKSAAGAKVPERLFFLKQHVATAETALEHELGRPASAAELSEHMKVPLEQIAKARQSNSGISTGAMVDPESGVEASIAGQPRQEARDTWAKLVHADLDPHHQLVMEHSLGMYGKPIMSNQDLAAKLKRSPGAISQAKARIQKLLDEEQDLSPFMGH